MPYFKYKADIIPVSIFIVLFMIDVCMYLIWISGLTLWFYCMFSIMTKWFIAAWNHHHQHVHTFSKPVLNRALEIIYGFQTGIVGFGWMLHHNLGHHANYQDQTKDESAWKSKKWKRYHPLIYTWIVTITAYYRAWNVWNKHHKIQKKFLYMCLIQCVLLFSLIAYQPLQWTIIFLIPMITWLVITVYTTYHHHSWLESDDPYKSSYNIIEPRYNFLTGNLGYHTAHHLKGWLHWSKLPEFHKSIENKIEKKYYKKYNFLWYSTRK